MVLNQTTPTPPYASHLLPTIRSPPDLAVFFIYTELTSAHAPREHGTRVAPKHASLETTRNFHGGYLDISGCWVATPYLLSLSRRKFCAQILGGSRYCVCIYCATLSFVESIGEKWFLLWVALLWTSDEHRW